MILRSIFQISMMGFPKRFQVLPLPPFCSGTINAVSTVKMILSTDEFISSVLKALSIALSVSSTASKSIFTTSLPVNDSLSKRVLQSVAMSKSMVTSTTVSVAKTTAMF
ncbi:MAG: hypothetical protein FE78DRAFT_381912 [Acidomyces sp. 'richmondensis']|nr:MAG: hypothetical protein FE78DRAFT_381912 [Acidomyces sp. 'richmondensis']